MSRMFNPPHPGEVLKEYLPAELSVTVAEKKARGFAPAFSAILNGRTGITADMALRLAKALDTSPDLWLGMQMQFELWHAKRQAPKGVRKLAA